MPSLSPVVDRQLAALRQGERPTTGSDEGTTSRKHIFNRTTQAYFVEIESGIQAAPRRASWRLDAVHSSGGNRIKSNGASPRADDAEWTHGNPVYFSLSTLTEDSSWTRDRYCKDHSSFDPIATYSCIYQRPSNASK